MTNWPKLFNKEIFCRAAILLVVLAVWVQLSPYILHWSDIVDMRRKMQEISPAKLTQMFENGKTPSVLYVNAAWCENCRPVGKLLLKMAERGDFKNVQFIALAMENSPSEMARNYVMQGYNKQFAPYIWQKGASLGNVLTLAGSALKSGALPYVAVISPEGQIVSEAVGEMDDAELAELMAPLRRSIR